MHDKSTTESSINSMYPKCITMEQVYDSSVSIDMYNQVSKVLRDIKTKLTIVITMYIV
jgi:hypothetical protein